MRSFHSTLSFNSTWQASDLIPHSSILQGPVFLVNSRYPPFLVAFYINLQNSPPYPRSYRVNLPSSFNVILSTTLVHLYQFTSVGLQYG
jgi:hypothetical protein